MCDVLFKTALIGRIELPGKRVCSFVCIIYVEFSTIVCSNLVLLYLCQCHRYNNTKLLQTIVENSYKQTQQTNNMIQTNALAGNSIPPISAVLNYTSNIYGCAARSNIARVKFFYETCFSTASTFTYKEI